MRTFALPFDDNEVTILGIISAVERAAAAEFCEFLNNQFGALGQKEWFEDVRHYRKSIGDPFTYKNPEDMRFIINEAVQDDSQIWHLIPNMNNAWTTAAIGLRTRLNNFHHGQLKPDLQSLLQIATLFDSIASSSGLGVADWARALKTRIKKILDGTFEKPVELNPPVAIPDVPSDVTDVYNETKKELDKRPPLGSKWQGEKPQRKLTLDRATEDLYEDGLSVSIELGELKEQTITTWLRYFPRGGEVWVDPDGASMAYVKGIARMVGWFGPEPDGDEHEVRGFVVPRDYEFTGSDVRHLESGKLLTSSSVDSVREIIEVLSKHLVQNDRVSITDYGDMFNSVTEGVAKKITRAHKDTWFGGHLPGS
jgi:hypothetical protein